MEEVIPILKNMLETNPELIIIGGGGFIIALVAGVIVLLRIRKGEDKPETIKSVDNPRFENLSLESANKLDDEVIAEEAIESEDIINSELDDEDSGDMIEFEEPEILGEDYRTRSDETSAEENHNEEESEETEEGLFSRLRAGLSRTQAGLLGKLDEMLRVRKEIDNNLWDDFEETLITADLGVGTTMNLRKEIQKKLTKKALLDPMVIKGALREEVLRVLKNSEAPLPALNVKPFVIMVAGVNGVGKTTSIGKLAYKFRKEQKSVMIAAADTFRAAAVEQLEIWAKRVESDFLKGQNGVDPSAVAFDAVRAAKARGSDILIIDTAGRLHTKTNLMDELKKIRRVIGRELEGAPHETLLVLDATTGQNAIQQAKIFKEAVEITGIILTKLDGTAKGGVIVAIADELKIPVKFIGIGERLGDLREFKAEEFVEALFLTGKETLH
ncbi:MAG TPA: signal recognition particle-docking protein FtsY [Thermodesulfobacteriota bacterium]